MAWKIEPEDPDELVTVAECGSQIELALARSRLEDAGIECFASDEHTARIIGGMTHLGGSGISLQVRRRDFRDAQELLNSPATDADEEQFPADEENGEQP